MVADLDLLYHCSSISWKPATHTNRWDWWLSPVTLLLGDKDIWMVLVT